MCSFILLLPYTDSRVTLIHLPQTKPLQDAAFFPNNNNIILLQSQTFYIKAPDIVCCRPKSSPLKLSSRLIYFTVVWIRSYGNKKQTQKPTKTPYPLPPPKKQNKKKSPQIKLSEKCLSIFSLFQVISA